MGQTSAPCHAPFSGHNVVTLVCTVYFPVPPHSRLAAKILFHLTRSEGHLPVEQYPQMPYPLLAASLEGHREVVRCNSLRLFLKRSIP